MRSGVLFGPPCSQSFDFAFAEVGVSMGVSESMAKCEKKLVKCKSGLKIVPVNDSCRSPFFLKEPSWVPDDEVALYSSMKIFRLVECCDCWFFFR